MKPTKNSGKKKYTLTYAYKTHFDFFFLGIRSKFLYLLDNNKKKEHLVLLYNKIDTLTRKLLISTKNFMSPPFNEVSCHVVVVEYLLISNVSINFFYLFHVSTQITDFFHHYFFFIYIYNLFLIIDNYF